MALGLELRILPGGWLEVRYEDTVADLPAQARRVLAFMELPWDEAVLKYRERLATRQVRGHGAE